VSCVDVYIITLSCTWRIYALSERLLVVSCEPARSLLSTIVLLEMRPTEGTRSKWCKYHSSNAVSCCVSIGTVLQQTHKVTSCVSITERNNIGSHTSEIATFAVFNHFRCKIWRYILARRPRLSITMMWDRQTDRRQTDAANVTEGSYTYSVRA